MNKIRIKALSKISIAILVPFMFYLFIPLTPWLFELGGSSHGLMTNCAALSLRSLVITNSIAVGILFIIYLPLLLGLVNKAIYLFIFGALSLGFYYGAWWLQMGIAVILCKAEPASVSVVWYSLFGLIILTAMVFIFYQRKA